jgi:TetR/AcrR family transcriptional repressor of nem operon
MRQVLCRGTQAIIRRLARAIEDGLSDGSLEHVISPDGLAEMLYQMWLGASLLAKMTGDSKPLKAALVSTAKLLHLDPTQPT